MDDFGFGVAAGISPADNARLTTLENNEYKITYYEIISGASGSLTLPTGATINAGEFGLSGNCILSKIDGSNKPTFESPKTSGGTIVTASLNETTGAWVASGTYTDTDVALIYSIKIKAVNYGNLDYNFIIETIEIDTGVQSVTGPQVDNTDPNNPIINPLGLIQIIDLNGEFFTDLATASAYISTVTSATITNESYSDGVYYFTVPQNTSFDLGPLFFLGFSPNNASIIDEIGLITSLVVSFGFYKNNGNHKLGNVTFVGDEFNSFSGTIEVKSIVDLTLPSDSFAENSTGKFIIKGNIGATPSGNSYSPFFLSSTATILVNKEQYTINSGGIQGDLVTAITNGCNVQFDGINLEKVSNKSTSVVTDQASNTKYPSVKSVFDWVTSTFATIASLASYVTITGTETLTNKTIKKRILVVTQSATPSTNIDNGDIMQITGLAQAITSMTTNLTGTPYDGQMIMWQITDNGTARAITWGASFASTTGSTLPTTTVISTMLRVITQYNLATSKHECQYVN